MINLTTNLKLKKPTDEESFDVEHMNSNNDVIDKSVGELENKLKNMKLESTAIDVVDTAGNFNADSHGKKLLEDVLVQINTKIQANSSELGTNKVDLLNVLKSIREVL